MKTVSTFPKTNDALSSLPSTANLNDFVDLACQELKSQGFKGDTACNMIVKAIKDRDPHHSVKRDTVLKIAQQFPIE